MILGRFPVDFSDWLSPVAKVSWEQRLRDSIGGAAADRRCRLGTEERGWSETVSAYCAKT